VVARGRRVNFATRIFETLQNYKEISVRQHRTGSGDAERDRDADWPREHTIQHGGRDELRDADVSTDKLK